MTDVNSSAVPSPAHEAVQYDSWDEKGTPIVAKKEPATKTVETPQQQDSAPAPTPEKKADAHTEGKPKTAAESDTAPSQEKKGKQTAEQRIQELIADRKVLEERLRKLEAAPQPTTKTEETKKAPEPPKRPNPFKWTGTPEEFEAAMDEYEKHGRAQAVAEAQREQFVQQSRQKTAEMMKQTIEKYPDAEAKIKQTATDLVKKAPEFVGLFVNESEVLTDLLYTLSDRTTLENLLETAKANPSKALRVLRDMELDIQKAVKKDAEPETTSDEPKKDPPSDSRPRAPKPPPEVGGRGASAEDTLVAAARANDFRSFEAEQNRRRQAAK